MALDEVAILKCNLLTAIVNLSLCHISDKPDCLPDGSGYLGTHNYPSYIRSCFDIAKPINSRKNLVSEFNRDEDSN